MKTQRHRKTGLVMQPLFSLKNVVYTARYLLMGICFET